MQNGVSGVQDDVAETESSEYDEESSEEGSSSSRSKEGPKGLRELGGRISQLVDYGNRQFEFLTSVPRLLVEGFANRVLPQLQYASTCWGRQRPEGAGELSVEARLESLLPHDGVSYIAFGQSPTIRVGAGSAPKFVTLPRDTDPSRVRRDVSIATHQNSGGGAAAGGLALTVIRFANARVIAMVYCTGVAARQLKDFIITSLAQHVMDHMNRLACGPVVPSPRIDLASSGSLFPPSSIDDADDSSMSPRRQQRSRTREDPTVPAPRYHETDDRHRSGPAEKADMKTTHPAEEDGTVHLTPQLMESCLLNVTMMVQDDLQRKLGHIATNSGASLGIALVDDLTSTVGAAHVGDIRVVLAEEEHGARSASSDDGVPFKARDLTPNAHTPANSEERQRVESTGSTVLNLSRGRGVSSTAPAWMSQELHGSKRNFVYATSIVRFPNGLELPVTRSLGYVSGAQWGLSSVPDLAIVRLLRKEDHTFLMMASHHVSDVFETPQNVIDFMVRQRLTQEDEAAAAALCTETLQFWSRTRSDDPGDIAVVLIPLDRQQQTMRTHLA